MTPGTACVRRGKRRIIVYVFLSFHLFFTVANLINIDFWPFGIMKVGKMDTRITGDIERINKHISKYKLTCLCLCIDR